MKNEIYIFGSSNAGKIAYKKLAKCYKIKGFLDNNHEKWGEKIEGIYIYNPDILKKEKKPIVYIASLYYEEISSQLNNMGICDYKIAPVFWIGEEDELINLQMDAAIRSLNYKLKHIKIDSLEISDYTKKYFSEYMKDLHTVLQRYGEIILYSVSQIKKNRKTEMDQYVFLDYGGGTGILSLLALEFGIKKVYYNDIYDVSVNDIKVLSEFLEYNIDDFILGDLEDVEKYCDNNNIKFDIIASYDVLEHIYDLEKYFANIDKICSEIGAICMVSSANPYNESIVTNLKEVHHRIEFYDKEEEYGRKKRDNLRAYLEIRKTIIEEYLTKENLKLDYAMVKAFAEKTRGMIKNDIERLLQNYFRDATMPVLKEHKFPSNTCDPYTGNWAEHLIDFEKLTNFINKNGFNVTLLPNQEEISDSPVIALFAPKRCL